MLENQKLLNFLFTIMPVFIAYFFQCLFQYFGQHRKFLQRSIVYLLPLVEINTDFDRQALDADPDPENDVSATG